MDFEMVLGAILVIFTFCMLVFAAKKIIESVTEDVIERSKPKKKNSKHPEYPRRW
jgi:hypothetical protein